jgi:hypothetical protein
MRAYAFAHDRRLIDVAYDVIAHQIDIDAEASPPNASEDT